MLGKLFGKKQKVLEETITAPTTGKLVELSEVPDPTFSQKMMGDGIAIDPADGKVISPVDGEVVQLFPTKHAIGIKGESGVEILIHIGLETVSMNGEGFDAHIKQGDKVNKGDSLVTFDLSLVKEKASSTIIPIVITNGDIVETLHKSNPSDVIAGETEVMTVKVKE